MTKLMSYVPPSRLPEPTGGSELFAQRAIDIANASDRGYLQGTTSMGQASSAVSWLNYNRIGEVRFSISRSARIAGYATFRGERIGKTNDVESIAESGVVADIVAEMYGKFGGTRGLIERFYTLMKIPAEAYPIWVNEAGMRDGLWFLSPDEIDRSSITGGKIDTSRPVKWITGRMSDDTGTHKFTREVAREDFLGRIWNPNKQFTDETDSAMIAINDQCEMLDTLTRSIMGRLRQRFALAGILLIPNEINDAAISGPIPDQGKYSSNKVMNYLITLMTRNVTMHDQGMSQMPALMSGPADVLDKVRHIIFDTQIAETDLKIRNELVNRILDGLDQQKQATQGGEGMSHWGAWAVSDEERRITVQPDLESLCFGLTKLVLWPALIARGWEPAKVKRWRVGYDLSAAAVKTNQAEDARQAFDRGAVGADFVRRTIGATDDDKMDNDEYVRWLGVKMTDPVMATYGLSGIEVSTLPVRTSNPNPGPNPDSPADDAQVGPGVGDPGSPDSRDSDERKTEAPG